MNIFKTHLSCSLLSLILVTGLTSSCSGFRPESIEEKMNRFKAQNLGENIVPTSFVNNDLLIKKISRGPASTNPKRKKSETLPYNNKKLYFLTLLDQYKYMKTFSKNSSMPEIIICPKFHSVLVRHGENYPSNNYNAKNWTPDNYESTKFADEKYLASHPELNLPVSKGNAKPTVVDLLKKASTPKENIDIIYKAFDVHLTKTYSELQELCEYGNSNNYYTYENLNTLVKKDQFTKNSKNLGTLLRTTIFSNMALKLSLDKRSTKAPSRGIASVISDTKNLEDEVIQRLNVYWSKEYLQSL